MQFILICRDRPGALPDRLAARERHMKDVRRLKAEGRILDGGAILDGEGNMCGSVVLCDFTDRNALDAYLAEEVYMREGIWEQVEVLPFRRVAWD